MCQASGPVICTVVSRSQLPYARVLAAALRRLDSAARLTVLVMDCARGDPDAEFDALGLREVIADPDPALYALPEPELRWRARAALLLHGLERGEDVVLVEPELDLHAPLDDLRSLAATHGVALVPRLLAPIPDDGERPTYADVARGGIFDFGALAVGANPAGRAFAEWWQAALRLAGSRASRRRLTLLRRCFRARSSCATSVTASPTGTCRAARWSRPRCAASTSRTSIRAGRTG